MLVASALCAFAEEAAPAKWMYKNQEEWLVSQTVQDVAEMLLYAAAKKNGKAFDLKRVEFACKQIDKQAEKYSVTVSAPELPSKFSCELQFKRYIFETQTYAEVASKLMSALGLAPEKMAGKVDSARLLKRLSDFDMGSLHEQNEVVSKALNEHPLVADYHEQAALIAETFSMMDMSRNFMDRLHGNSRVAAHLGVASALRKSPAMSPPGTLAEIAICAILAREGEAVQNLDELLKQPKDPIVLSWARALKMAATNDMRDFDKAHCTPVEAYQYLIRVIQTRDGEEAAHYLAKRNIALNAHWLRLINLGYVTTREGHAYRSRWLFDELADFPKDVKLWTHRTSADFVTELNTVPTRCAVAERNSTALQVISWADVANWHQRQILGAFATGFGDLEEAQGLPENAESALRQVQSDLPKLRLFPFVFASAESSGKFVDRAVHLVDQAPALVPLGCWAAMMAADKSNKMKRSLMTWAGDLPLFGTAYRFSMYAWQLETHKLDLATLTNLRRIAPYNRFVCHAYATVKYGPNPTGDQLIEAYGPIAAIDIIARRQIAYADEDKPEIRLPRWASYAMKDDAAEFPLLAEYCWSTGRIADTWKYCKQYMDSSEPAETKAKHALPWILHLSATGQKQQARAVADSMAATNTYPGLYMKGRLCEVERNFASAEQYYRKMYEQSGDPEALDLFFIRNKGNPKYTKMAAANVGKYFPNGLMKETPADRSTAPFAGMLIQSVKGISQRAGLHKGDVITALNGYRVFSYPEYRSLNWLTETNKLSITVWNGKDYKQLTIPSLTGMLGVEATTYARRANRG